MREGEGRKRGEVGGKKMEKVCKGVGKCDGVWGQEQENVLGEV